MNSLAAKNAESAKAWPMVRLGDVCEINYGTRVRKRDSKGDAYPVYGGGGETFRWDSYNRIDKCVVSRFAMSAECVRFVNGPFFLNDSGLTVESKLNQLTQVYLDWFLFGNQDLIYSIGKGSAQKNLDMKEFADIQIPLPPINIQKEIVERLEKELGEADKVAAEFKRMAELADKEFKAELDETFNSLSANSASPREIKNDGCVGFVTRGAAEDAEKWPMVRLGDVCEVVSGNSAPQDKSLYENGVYPFVRTSDVGLIHFGKLNKTRDYLNEDGIHKLRKFSKGSILFPKSGASTFLNHRVLLEIDAYVASHLAVISPITQKVLSEYLLFLLSTIDAKDLLQDSNYPALRASEIEGIKIPLPPIEVQKEIVAKLNAAKERCEKLKAEAERGLRAAQKLRKAILSEAFE